MNTASEVRLIHAAMAFGALSDLPASKAAEAVKVLTEGELNAIESGVRKIGEALATSGNGATALGERIRAWVNAPGPVEIVRAAEAAPEPVDASADEIRWTKHGKGERASYAAQFRGTALKIERHGPADYEGFVGGHSVAKGKFKRNVRERTEAAARKL